MTARRKGVLAGAAVTGAALAICLAIVLWPKPEANAAELPLYDPADVAWGDTTLYFEATVLEVGEEQLLVAPLEGTSAQMAFGEVLVNTTMVNGERVGGFEEGQVIGVLFDGKVAMSNPAQVLSVYGFFRTETEHNDQ